MSQPDLQDQLEYLLRQGAPYEFAPDLGCEILDQIDAFLARYVAYPDDDARRAHVLWIAHTWFMDAWYTTPRLLFVSPEAGSGKTRALTVTQHLVPNPDFTTDLTPAYLYHVNEEQRKINGGRPTMLYDELDTVFGGGGRYERMRRILDSGHARDATVNRYLGGKKGGIIRYSVYCAMAMAGMMDVSDVPATIRTRSVVIRMQRRAPGETVERWNRRTSPAEAEQLRDLLQFWAEFVHEHALNYLPEMPDEISDRDADVWEPLLSVADLAGGHWPETARVTGVTRVTVCGVQAVASRGMQLLADTKEVFDSLGVDMLFTERLVTELKGLEESPWAGLTAAAMAKLLSGYGVEPRLQRMGGRSGRVARGYRRGYFTDAWQRYVPVTPVAPVTPEVDGE
jgi:hypothetical protein